MVNGLRVEILTAYTRVSKGCGWDHVTHNIAQRWFRAGEKGSLGGTHYKCIHTIEKIFDRVGG